VSYVTTGAWNFIKIPQYIEESTFGTTPPTPTFVSCGAITDWAFTADISVVTNRQLGSRDIYQDVKTAEMYQIVMKYQPYNVQFMRYGTQLFNSATSATDNISKSLSITWSQLINGTENFFLAKGCRTDKIEINVTEPKVEVTQTILAQSVNSPATTFTGAGGPSGATFCAPNTGAPWSGINGGSQPFHFSTGGVDTAYDTVTFKTTISNNIDKIKPLGETTVKFLDPTNRDIAVDVELVLNAYDIYADMKSLTPRAAKFSLNSSSSALINFTNLYLEKYASPDSPTANKTKTVSYSGRAQQISVTDNTT
jgi:hypothetical protein